VAVVGVARRTFTDEQFREMMLAAIRQFSRTQPVDMDRWQAFAQRWHYQVVDVDSPGDYQALSARLGELDARGTRAAAACSTWPCRRRRSRPPSTTSDESDSTSPHARADSSGS